MTKRTFVTQRRASLGRLGFSGFLINLFDLISSFSSLLVKFFILEIVVMVRKEASE